MEDIIYIKQSAIIDHIIYVFTLIFFLNIIDFNSFSDIILFKKVKLLLFVMKLKLYSVIYQIYYFLSTLIDYTQFYTLFIKSNCKIFLNETKSE
jgi:hypothetical protein